MVFRTHHFIREFGIALGRMLFPNNSVMRWSAGKFWINDIACNEDFIAVVVAVFV